MIQATDLSKYFGSFPALKQITCNIPKGSICGLVGSNGAGKSTLLRLMTGIYQGETGSMKIENQPVYNNALIKSKIAFVPDALYFLPGSNMLRMAKFYRAFYPDFDTARFEQLSKLFDLNTKRPLNTFSKGMRRQAAAILTLSARPLYMFFDETFDGWDPIVRNLVKRLIYDDVIERKATAVITSHSLRELEDLCDRLALIHKGRLELESDIQNLKTSLFKIQIAFSDEYDKSRFEQIDILHYSQNGSVAKIIIRGDRDKILQMLRKMNPLLLDTISLSLEEIFTYEMESFGYLFSDIIGGSHRNEEDIF